MISKFLNFFKLSHLKLYQRILSWIAMVLLLGIIIGVGCYFCGVDFFSYLTKILSFIMVLI